MDELKNNSKSKLILFASGAALGAVISAEAFSITSPKREWVTAASIAATMLTYGTIATFLSNDKTR